MPTSRHPVITHVLLLPILLGVICHGGTLVGQNVEGVTRAYPLRYVPAEPVAEQLQTVFASLRGEGSVAVDPRTGSLIVHGGEQAHALATQLIRRADRPENARQRLTAGGEPVVEGYAVPDAVLQKTLAALRSTFPASTGIKFAANDDGQQILALAPPDAQVQISRYLSQTLADPRTNTPQQKIIQDQWELRNRSSEEVVARLMQIWGRRLPAATTQEGAELYTIPAPGGAKLNVQIDHRKRVVHLQGPSGAVNAWRRVVAALDAPAGDPKNLTAVKPLRYAEREKVEFALAGFRAAQREPWAGDLVNMIFQPIAQVAQQPPEAPGPDGEPPAENQPQQPIAPPVPPAVGDGDGPGVIGPVQIEFLEGLDVIVIRGNKRDVERVTKIIDDIERLSAQTQPEVEVYPLQHTNNEAVVEIVTEVYNQYFAPRHGSITITPLVKPNAVLLVGRPEAVVVAKDLIAKVDEPVSPDSQFRVFPLRFLPVQQAQTMLTEFYEERGGLGTRVRVSADYRSNSLVVQGSPRDLQEIAAMLKELDVAEIESVNELRVFHLRNSLAEDLAPVIQQAIRGDLTVQGTGGQQAGGVNQQDQIRSTMLTLATIDSEGGKLLKSGVLTDVQVQPDFRANALVVRGPRDAMELIGALIQQLDRLPSEAQIKVFTIINGDAASLATTLDELFGLQQGGQNQPGVALGAGQGESTLVPLRFSVDLRTNSILASGSGADLQVVEAILLRLDEGDIRERITVVYRLKNSPAPDVAAAINNFLGAERDVQQLAQGQATPFEQIEREVIVVPEPVTNTLIVSASPRYFPEVERIVEQLDERPPMVMIQVLIAEVLLDDTNELGVELGIQDSLLFDRSGVDSGDLMPGFDFNNQPLGNSGDATSLGTREKLAGQALTDLALSRMGSLGYGGLVLSASSESLNILIRALQDRQNLQVLSRPQIMTLDNQPAFIQVGEQVPYIDNTTVGTGATTTATTTYLPTGILLGVTPRISPDGQVVMQIDAEVSRAGDPATGVNGAPRIDTINAQTVVSARSGQTIILGGLIQRRTETRTRQVPYLSDIPVLGNLFRFDALVETRGELIFVMTPHIVRTEADAQVLKQVESQRMSWCLADVINVHGDVGLSGAYDTMSPFAGPTMMSSGADCLLPDGTAPQIFEQRAPTEEIPLPVPAQEGRQEGPQFAPPTGEPHEFGQQFVVPEHVRPAGYLHRQSQPGEHQQMQYYQPQRLPPTP